MAQPLFIKRKGGPEHKFPTKLGTDVPSPFIPYEDNRPRLLVGALLLPGLWFNSAIMPEGPKPGSVEEFGQVRAAQSRQDRTEQPPNLALRIPPPFAGDDFGQQKLAVRQTWEPQNTTLNLPVVAAASPFIPADLDGPRKQVRQTQPEVVPSKIVLELVFPPFIRNELDGPRQLLKTLQESQPSRALLDIKPPIVPEDFGQTKPGPYRQADLTPNLIIQAVTAQAVLPFQDLDWSLPRQPWKLASGHHWFNSAIMPNPDAPPASIAPFVPYEWANAKGKLRPKEAAEQSRLVLEIVPVTKPFYPLDWSVPKRTLKRMEQADQYPLVLMPAEQAVTREALVLHVERPAPRFNPESVPSRAVLEIVTTPFLSKELGQAKANRPWQAEPVQNLLVSTLAVPQFPFFGQTTPNAPLPKLGDRNWNQNLLENTLGLSIATPFAQYEWPLPQGIRAPEVRIVENQGSNITAVPPTPPVPPVVDSTATPGRTLQGRLLRPPFTVESDEDKRARRAREALADAPKVEKAPDLSAYYKQSARISKAISDARAEADTLRPKIAELEAKAAKAKLTAKLEKQLLHAQQQLTLISVQEAVLLEEMEAIDVAFIALIAYMQATS